MSTLIENILNGVSFDGPREVEELKILANFDGDEVQAGITIDNFHFVNGANEEIKNWFENLPTENMPYTPVISDGETTIAEPFFLNFHDYRVLSDVECSISVEKQNGVTSLMDLSKGLTMELLRSKGRLGVEDWINVPYVVENRKQLLEFVQMQAQLFAISKMIYDEIFKLVNIVSDIASGLWVTTAPAGVVAAANLAQSIINLAALTVRLVILLKDMQEAFFPVPRYHLGINLWTWISRAIVWLGYELETSPEFEGVLSKIVLLGSKRDQKGLPAFFVEGEDIIDLFPEGDPGNGLLEPDDYGYTLFETLELIHTMFHTKISVSNGVVQLRPFNDPFWFNSAGYTWPDVIVEQALNIDNGIRRYNYEDMVSRTLVQYTKDDSDLHTLTNINDSIAEASFSAISIEDRTRVNIRGIDDVQIPYALCVRKEETEGLFSFFSRLGELFLTLKTEIEKLSGEYPALAEKAIDIADFAIALYVRAGSLKVENDFFSVPKIVYLDPDTQRIPPNFADFIGADQLYRGYHSYKSMAPGLRNPAVPSETYQKIIYEGVRIPFGINDFNETIENSFFWYETDKLAKFTKIEWDVLRDEAVVDFYIFQNWNNNIQGELVEL